MTKTKKSPIDKGERQRTNVEIHVKYKRQPDATLI